MFIRSFRSILSKTSRFKRKSSIHQVNSLPLSLPLKFSSSSNPKLSNSSEAIWKFTAAGTMLIGLSYIAYNRYKSSPSPSHTEVATDQSESVSSQPETETKSNNLIEDLPSSVKYLVIGGGHQGYAAARAIRSNDWSSRVLIVSEEDHYPYSRNPLTKELWFNSDPSDPFSFSQIDGHKRSIYFEHEEFYLPLKEFSSAPHGGISVLKSHRIIRIDPDLNIAYLDNNQSISFEKCIIATGKRPKKLPIFDRTLPETVRREKIIYFRTPEDFQCVEKLLAALKSLTIIGNGLIANELVFSISNRSKQIKSDVKINQILNQTSSLQQFLPSFLSQWCSERAKYENVNVLNNVDIEDVQFVNDQIRLKLSNGNLIDTDICIVDNGYEPNNDLALTSGLEIDPVDGRLITNAELQIRNNIWGAGSVISYFDQKYGRENVQGGTIFTGRLAGLNASASEANQNKTPRRYDYLPRFWSDLGEEIGFEAFGKIDSNLPTFSMFVKNFDQNDDGSLDEKYKFHRGIILYQEHDSIVGVVLWNIFDVVATHLAKQIISDGFKNQDPQEVAKLFPLFAYKEIGVEASKSIDESGRQENTSDTKQNESG